MRNPTVLLLFAACSAGAPPAAPSLTVGFTRDWQTWSPALLDPGGSITGKIFLGTYDEEVWVGLFHDDGSDCAWRLRAKDLDHELLRQFKDQYGDDRQWTLSWDGAVLCLR